MTNEQQKQEKIYERLSENCRKSKGIVTNIELPPKESSKGSE